MIALIMSLIHRFFIQLSYRGHESKHCGSTAPGSGQLIRTNVQRVTLQFHSDYAVEQRGFKLTYTTSSKSCLFCLMLKTSRQNCFHYEWTEGN